MKDAKGHGSNGRGANAMPIPGHPYHNTTDAQLRYIQQDAHAAAQATRGMTSYNPNSGKREDTEGKYLNQVNDASTVLAYRQRGGERVPTDDETAAHELAAGGGPKAVAAPIHDGASGPRYNLTSGNHADRYGAGRDRAARIGERGADPFLARTRNPQDTAHLAGAAGIGGGYGGGNK